MKNHRRKLFGLIASLIFLAGGGGLISCQLFNRQDKQSPTTPDQTAASLSNFYASKSRSDQFEATEIGKEFFRVNVGAAGDYLLTYRTSLGMFYLVFRTEQATLLTIGLNENDTVFYAWIQEGQLTEAALNEAQNAKASVSGPVKIYFGPEQFQDNARVAMLMNIFSSQNWFALIANMQKLPANTPYTPSVSNTEGVGGTGGIQGEWAFEWTTDYGDTIKGTLTFSGTESSGSVTEQHQGVEETLTLTGAYSISAQNNTITFNFSGGANWNFQGAIHNQNSMSGTYTGYSDGTWKATRTGGGQTTTGTNQDGWTLLKEIQGYFPSAMPDYENAQISSNADPNNPLLFTIKTTNNWTIRFLGRNKSSSDETVDYMVATAPDGVTLTYKFDQEGRLVQSSTGDGNIVVFDWNAKTIDLVSGRIDVPSELNSLSLWQNTADNFKAMARATNPGCSQRMKQTNRLGNYATQLIAGTIAGVAAGSVVPGVGTAAGGVIGAVLGGLAGAIAADIKDDKVEQWTQEQCDAKCEGLEITLNVTPDKLELSESDSESVTIDTTVGSIIYPDKIKEQKIETRLGKKMSGNKITYYYSDSPGDDITFTVMTEKGCTATVNERVEIVRKIAPYCPKELKPFCDAVGGKFLDPTMFGVCYCQKWTDNKGLCSGPIYDEFVSGCKGIPTGELGCAGGTVQCKTKVF